MERRQAGQRQGPVRQVARRLVPVRRLRRVARRRLAVQEWPLVLVERRRLAVLVPGWAQAWRLVALG